MQALPFPHLILHFHGSPKSHASSLLLSVNLRGNTEQLLMEYRLVYTMIQELVAVTTSTLVKTNYCNKYFLT
jgi:hypothetical protein